MFSVDFQLLTFLIYLVAHTDGQEHVFVFYMFIKSMFLTCSCRRVLRLFVPTILSSTEPLGFAVKTVG